MPRRTQHAGRLSPHPQVLADRKTIAPAGTMNDGTYVNTESARSSNDRSGAVSGIHTISGMCGLDVRREHVVLRDELFGDNGFV